MEETEFNPYAAPVSQETASMQDGLWQVSGSVLLFRDGARLPDVDVFTGRDDVPLTPASSEFACIKGILSVLVNWSWVPVLALLSFSDWSFSDWGFWRFGLIAGIIIVSSLLGSFMKGAVVRAQLYWKVSTEVNARNRWRSRLRTGLFVFGLGFFLATVMADSLDWMIWGLVLMSLCSVAAVVIGALSRNLRCSGEKDGWFTLKGIPSDGLRALAERQGESNRQLLESPTNLKMRKVYAFYGYKAPLRDLLSLSWSNPILIVIITMMKLTRSKKLVRDHFHESESSNLEEESWDPELVKLRDEWLAMEESSGWCFLNAQWIGAPTGDILTQSFMFISPDGSQSILGAVVRLATARASRMICEVTFRSWSGDGSLYLTSNQRVMRPLPVGCLLKMKKGGVADVFAAHQVAVRDEQMVSLGFPEEWEARIAEEAELRRSVLETAGIKGPVREVELPC